MELVKYHNDFNNVSLKGFKEKELDLLFSICFKLRDEGIEEINLTFSELKELSKYNDRHLLKFIKDLDNVYKKLIGLNFKYEDEKKITRFVLFKAYTIYKDEKMVTIKVNEEFKYILNELTGNYTKFELAQFTSLKSSYTKIIFRLLKQYFSTGWREFFYSEFRELLSIPDSYKPSDIDKQILKPSIEDLKKYFKNIKIIKIKNGRNLYKIRFEWEIVILLPKDNKTEKTTKEKNTENLIKKQSEDIELGEIINKEINEKYNNYLELSKEVRIKIEKIIYRKFLEKSNAEDNKILKGIFEKSKKPLIVEEYEEILKEIETENISEEKELIEIDEKILEEPKQLLENFEEENSIEWEHKTFITEPKTNIEIEAEKIIKNIFPFLDDELLEEDINYIRLTLRRKKMYKELEILDLFLEKKQSLILDFNDIYKDEKCLGLSNFGKDYIENYIKENNLEYLLISEKTKRELKGSAREQRLMKIYKTKILSNA